MADTSILVINTGSSSLKLGIYTAGAEDEQLTIEGLAEGIGRERGTLVMRDARGRVLRSDELHLATQRAALQEIFQWLREASFAPPIAIGHRVVHGGPHLTEHQLLTAKVLCELRECVHFAPIHIPMALSLIEAAQEAYPDISQFACFDTAFHRTMPEIAARFPLPRDLYERGIRRYGFHGLSYESIVHRLGSDPPARTVIAHLGNGASLAAVQNGRSVDTTMGLTPVGGIPMSTRSGDLDPGILLYLMRTGHADADDLEKMLNGDAGLKAVSGGESDMRVLEAKANSGDIKAQLAIEIFCNSVRKTVAAYAAVLGGLDLLVFTGGIGEHSAALRMAVCHGLAFLGINLDQAANAQHANRISALLSQVEIRVIVSEEDRQIARHCRRMYSPQIHQSPQ